jgi:hypothetical protein
MLLYFHSVLPPRAYTLPYSASSSRFISFPCNSYFSHYHSCFCAYFIDFQQNIFILVYNIILTICMSFHVSPLLGPTSVVRDPSSPGARAVFVNVTAALRCVHADVLTLSVRPVPHSLPVSKPEPAYQKGTVFRMWMMLPLEQLNRSTCNPPTGTEQVGPKWQR